MVVLAADLVAADDDAHRGIAAGDGLGLGLGQPEGPGPRGFPGTLDFVDGQDCGLSNGSPKRCRRAGAIAGGRGQDQGS